MRSIVLDGVDKVFRSAGFFFADLRRVETCALSGVSMKVNSGEIVALLGPNGSGKTTTLKLVSSILLPDRGRVVVSGCDTRRNAQAARAQIGFALASERSFFPRLTVRENLEFFATLEDVPRQKRGGSVNSVLRDLDLHLAADKQVMKLSSGMYQRLAIARALVKRPSVLLLDEPTRSLDPAAAASLCGLIRYIAANGVTVLLASHNFAEAIAVADRVAILQRGKLVAVRNTALLNTEQLRNYYLSITGEQEAQPVLEEVPA